jgi:ABC-type phosphate/phosphonate transport system permease subunit
MRRLVASVAIFWLLPLLALASGDEPATAISERIDTSHLAGNNLQLVNLYNDHRVLYAAATTVAMALFGILIAFVVDAVLARLGLKVSKVEHRE